MEMKRGDRMKAILEFDLYEEKEEFEVAYNARSYATAVDKIDNYLRNEIKYKENSNERHKVLQEVRDKLNEICEDYIRL